MYSNVKDRQRYTDAFLYWTYELKSHKMSLVGRASETCLPEQAGCLGIQMPVIFSLHREGILPRLRMWSKEPFILENQKIPLL